MTLTVEAGGRTANLQCSKSQAAQAKKRVEALRLRISFVPMSLTSTLEKGNGVSVFFFSSSITGSAREKLMLRRADAAPNSG